MSTAYNPEKLSDRQQLANELVEAFKSMNFVEVKKPNCAEKVFEYKVKQVPGVAIQVYSTIVGEQVRSIGADAIRISVVYSRRDGGELQLFSTRRINRVGQIDEIVKRAHKQAQEAFVKFRERQRSNMYCAKCKAPQFLSKAGNNVCADTCWVQQATS